MTNVYLPRFGLWTWLQLEWVLATLATPANSADPPVMTLLSTSDLLDQEHFIEEQYSFQRIDECVMYFKGITGVNSFSMIFFLNRRSSTFNVFDTLTFASGFNVSSLSLLRVGKTEYTEGQQKQKLHL